MALGLDKASVDIQNAIYHPQLHVMHACKCVTEIRKS